MTRMTKIKAIVH